MKDEIHTLRLPIDWALISQISKIDRFDATWSSIEIKEGQYLQQLKHIETIRSVGASTRIEGAKLSDTEVSILLDNIDITKLEDRDSQEVIGYFEALDLISSAYLDVPITENSLKSLHNMLLKHSTKDGWHKGNYKQHTNAVEARLADGTKHIIFRTTEAGMPTDDAMQALIRWYQHDDKTHPLVKCALFSYEFVSIHPFQDGNGRLSRMLATLLLLKNGYKWIQYVSLEHEIEARKDEYYRVLRSCQAGRPNEDVTDWVYFFFDCLLNIQKNLLKKLEYSGIQAELLPVEKMVLRFIENHAGCKSGQISQKLKITKPTVKRILVVLIKYNLIEKLGQGPGTVYQIL